MVGQTVWVLDSSKGSVYKYPKEITITGETSRSWIAGSSWRPEKYPKKTLKVISEEEAQSLIQDREWDNANRHKIAQMVGWAVEVDTEKLKKIAELIGYSEVKR